MTDEERRERDKLKQRKYRARKRLADPNYNAAYAEKKARQTQRRKYLLGQYKVRCGCEECGWAGHPAALDFDHVEPDKKEFHIAQSIAGRSIKTIFKEVRKCRVLCANCHRIHTYNEAQGRRKYD
jgi:hypothetical protein